MFFYFCYFIVFTLFCQQINIFSCQQMLFLPHLTVDLNLNESETCGHFQAARADSLKLVYRCVGVGGVRLPAATG